MWTERACGWSTSTWAWRALGGEENCGPAAASLYWLRHGMEWTDDGPWVQWHDSGRSRGLFWDHSGEVVQKEPWEATKMCKNPMSQSEREAEAIPQKKATFQVKQEGGRSWYWKDLEHVDLDRGLENTNLRRKGAAVQTGSLQWSWMCGVWALMVVMFLKLSEGEVCSSFFRED